MAITADDFLNKKRILIKAEEGEFEANDKLSIEISSELQKAILRKFEERNFNELNNFCQAMQFELKESCKNLKNSFELSISLIDLQRKLPNIYTSTVNCSNKKVGKTECCRIITEKLVKTGDIFFKKEYKDKFMKRYNLNDQSNLMPEISKLELSLNSDSNKEAPKVPPHKIVKKHLLNEPKLKEEVPLYFQCLLDIISSGQYEHQYVYSLFNYGLNNEDLYIIKFLVLLLNYSSILSDSNIKVANAKSFVQLENPEKHKDESYFEVPAKANTSNSGSVGNSTFIERLNYLKEKVLKKENNNSTLKVAVCENSGEEICKLKFEEYSFQTETYDDFEISIRNLGLQINQCCTDSKLLMELHSILLLHSDSDFSELVAEYLYNELEGGAQHFASTADKDYFIHKLNLIFTEEKDKLTKALKNNNSQKFSGSIIYQGKRFCRPIFIFEFEEPLNVSSFNTNDILLMAPAVEDIYPIIAELIEITSTKKLKLALNGCPDTLKLSKTTDVKVEIWSIYSQFFFTTALATLSEFTSPTYTLDKSIKSAILAGNQNEIMQITANYNSGLVSRQKLMLNSSSSDTQSLAVSQALNRPLTLILGPPGTGKTTTACEIVKRWCDMKCADETILVCADSNIAVDKIYLDLVSKGLKAVRVGLKSKLNSQPSFNTDQVGFIQMKSEKEGQQIVRSFQDAKLKLRTFDIICCTLFGSLSACFDSIKFTHVLIDESTQATEISTLFSLKKTIKQLVLIGDHNQLPPTVISKKAVSKGLNISLFERLINLGMQAFLLNEQFRMHPSLIEFSNRTFYNSQIKNHHSTNFLPIPGFAWPNEMNRFVFLDTSKTNTLEVEENCSYYNPEECEIVMSILENINIEGLPASSVGVITPYDAQKQKIRKLMIERFEGSNYFCDVDTVDGYQGMEKDLIILSFVRNNPSSTLGFIKDYRRLNVSLTRAKRGMIIVGNADTLGKDKLLNQLIQMAKSNNCLLTSN